MSIDRSRFTREELHELVWSRPIHQLAAEVGLSDVGLAKICKRLGIPRPGRGHWAKLAAGKVSRRIPLPKDKEGKPDSVELVRRPVVEKPNVERREPPIVPVPEDLRAAHEVTRKLNRLLDEKPYGDPPMLVVRGRDHSVIRVSTDSKRRALLALDALFKGLAARGHEVRLRDAGELVRRDGVDLHVVVGGEEIGVALIEKTSQKPHVLTAKEIEQQKRSSFAWAPRYDHVSTGLLGIELDKRRYGSGPRFADGKRMRLEDRLGQVVLAAEDLSDQKKVEREQQRLAQERATIARQRQEAEREQQEHMAALGNDLLQMAARWAEATHVQAFLDAYERRLPQEEKTEAELAWIAWARSFATQRDPLARLELVAKRMTP